VIVCGVRVVCVCDLFLFDTGWAWEVARTVVAPPSSVVKCVWEVFVWGFGVLFLCVCVGVGGVVLCRCVCVTC